MVNTDNLNRINNNVANANAIHDTNSDTTTTTTTTSNNNSNTNSTNHEHMITTVPIRRPRGLPEPRRAQGPGERR